MTRVNRDAERIGTWAVTNPAPDKAVRSMFAEASVPPGCHLLVHNRVLDKVSRIPGQNGPRVGITLFHIRLRQDPLNISGVHKNPVLLVLAKEGDARTLRMIREGSSRSRPRGRTSTSNGEAARTDRNRTSMTLEVNRDAQRYDSKMHGRKECETNH